MEKSPKINKRTPMFIPESRVPKFKLHNCQPESESNFFDLLFLNLNFPTFGN